MTKTKTTILLVTLLLLSLMAGSITLTPASAQSSKPKLRLIERGQYWDRYYDPSRNVYILHIYADAQYVKDPYTGSWVPYIWEHCQASEPCLYRVWIPHASFDVNKNGTITVYDVNRTQAIFLERFMIHYTRETRLGLKIPVHEMAIDFHHEIEEHGNETLIKLTYTYPSGTLTVEINLHKGAHYAKILHFKPINPNLRYSIILERKLSKTDLKLKIRDRLISLRNILTEETLSGNLASLDLRDGKKLMAKDVFPRPELLKSVRLLLGRIRYRFGEFRGEAKFRDPTTTISPPTDDSHVYKNNPDNNYGSSSTLFIDDSDLIMRIYIRFDLSSIPSNAQIIYAKLSIYRSDTGSNPTGKTVKIYRVTEDWNESDITWNNQPNSVSVETDSATIPSGQTWLEFNVTGDVQGFINGSYDNYGWVIKCSDCPNDSEAWFRSKEYSEADYHPKLEIIYGSIETVTTTQTINNTVTETVTTTVANTTYYTTIYETISPTYGNQTVNYYTDLANQLMPLVMVIGVICTMLSLLLSATKR